MGRNDIKILIMKNLIIVGARGFGREIYSLAKNCIGYNSEFNITGFLDDKFNALDKFENYPPILSSVEEYQIKENDVFIIALGDVNYKKIYTEKIMQKQGEFYSLIHPTAIINQNATIGVGTIVGQYAFVSNDVIIGDHVIVHCFCDFGHDVKIGNYCSMGAFTFLGGNSQIGDLVTLHPRGSIMPHKKVNNGAIVGAGSVVMRNVPANVTVHGNPAKVIFSEHENK